MSKKDYRELDRPIESARISTPKKTAFKTLKDYCKHNLEPDEYKIVPETSSYLATIYFITDGVVTYHCFDSEGNFSGAGSLDFSEDMNEHIEQAESEGKYEISY